MKFTTVSLFLSFFIFTSCAQMGSGRYVKDKDGRWQFVSENKGLISYFQSSREKNEDVLRTPASNEKEYSTYGQAIDPQKSGFFWPVPASRKVSSPFGERWGRAHEGIDIAAPVGSHILSVANGVIVYSGDDFSGYGKLTIIAHQGGYFSLYAHALKNYTRKGQRVHKGEVIALVGMTGRTEGPHLHFEVRRDSKAYNPQIFLSDSH